MSPTLLTKEELFNCLQRDGIMLSRQQTRLAKEGEVTALFNIGMEYQQVLHQYDKSMAWFQLASAQNCGSSQNNIGFLYEKGLGVNINLDLALRFYLKAAGNNVKHAMSTVGSFFANGQVVPVDLYKGLEWYYKGGDRPHVIAELEEHVFIKEEDKDKPLQQLIYETEEIIRKEQEKKHNALKEQLEMKNNENFHLCNANRELQNALAGKLDDKDNTIEMLRRENEIYQKEITSLHTLVKSKSSEIESLNEIIKLLREKERDHQCILAQEKQIQELQLQIEENQHVSPSSASRQDDNSNNESDDRIRIKRRR